MCSDIVQTAFDYGSFLQKTFFVTYVDGIIVTHNIASAGNGITVRDTGKLVMSAGEISGNTGVDKNGEAILGFDMAVGGGVYNMGTFEMSGGVIANNTSAGHGGGCIP